MRTDQGEDHHSVALQEVEGPDVAVDIQAPITGVLTFERMDAQARSCGVDYEKLDAFVKLVLKLFGQFPVLLFKLRQILNRHVNYLLRSVRNAATLVNSLLALPAFSSASTSAIRLSKCGVIGSGA